MASSKRAYPRATIRKVLKAHANKNIGRNVDKLVSDGLDMHCKVLWLDRECKDRCWTGSAACCVCVSAIGHYERLVT